jgi:hypothetical protein
MKYLVPPIVIPVLLFIGIVAYGMLRPPTIVGHPPAPAANSQTRSNGVGRHDRAVERPRLEGMPPACQRRHSRSNTPPRNGEDQTGL